MTASIINQELDSFVLDGLRLLHSKDPESIEQLKQLWKQSVKEKYGNEREPVSILHKISVPSGLKRESTHEIGDDFQMESKKSKLESSSLLHKAAPVSPQSSSSNVFNYIGDDVEVNVSSSDEDSDFNDSPLEILNGDGICMKCKGSSSNHNNKLVECVDCHKHYHQQCHFPPITDMDLSDPRFVWYCSTCEQNITTTTSSDKNKSSNSSSLAINKSLSSSKNVSSSTSKSSRSYSSTSQTSRSTILSSGPANKLSVNSSPKHSSSSSSVQDKKSQLLKKRTLKKHDKRKSAK